MHSIHSIIQLSPLLMFMFLLPPTSFGFIVPTRSSSLLARSSSSLPSITTTELHVKREPSEPTETSTSVNGINQATTRRTSTPELENNQNQNDSSEENPSEDSSILVDDDENPATQFIENVTESILDRTFHRVADKSLVQSYLLNRRSYARSGPFSAENLTKPSDVEDLLPEPTKIEDSFYLSAPAGVLTFIVACLAFPVLADFLVQFLDSSSQDLDEIVSKLVPGIGVLYGTFISTTLSILYNRQRFVQDSVAKETSMLSFLLQNMLYLFKHDRKRMVLSAQAAADQVRILLRETRGMEYVTIIYADPYTRFLHLIEEEEERLVEEHGDFLSKGPVLGTCRDTIRELRTFRAIRLSDESLALPDTHFSVLGAMTALILLGYVISVLPAVEDLGYTPVESTVLFGILSVIYLLFYCVAYDLNDLYNGVFQLRKGSSASHLLEIKEIVANHPWLRYDVDFERVNQEVMCFAPSLAHIWFENQQNFGQRKKLF